ncbi:hypothetical protein ELI_01960 [Erythrobacter litoralis HTCC2594]|uniref:Uncharacterized protein n=1 Tax=Erythrobacter litoralis (strain HTCC2594) TaxID=314225 RepID=Q2NCV7_ERYLH|nr:hypothetical protein ELI_01960 [Erythrobacter litoralis HTCC2594]
MLSLSKRRPYFWRALYPKKVQPFDRLRANGFSFLELFQ